MIELTKCPKCAALPKPITSTLIAEAEIIRCNNTKCDYQLARISSFCESSPHSSIRTPKRERVSTSPPSLTILSPHPKKTKSAEYAPENYEAEFA